MKKIQYCVYRLYSYEEIKKYFFADSMLYRGHPFDIWGARFFFYKMIRSRVNDKKWLGLQVSKKIKAERKLRKI